MLKERRHHTLLQMLKSQGAVSVTDISEALSMSPATVRRDIVELESRGLVERTWGGVRMIEDIDNPFQETLVSYRRAKQVIGENAATLIPDGATVIFDVGTTVYYVALALAARNITIITPSLPIFEEIRRTNKASLIMLGGQWSEKYQCFGGPGVVDALGHQYADFAFLGCTGISETGRVRDNSAMQSLTKRAILGACSHAYLLADSSKFPGQGTTSPFGVEEIDTIITDVSDVSPDFSRYCHDHHTQILHV